MTFKERIKNELINCAKVYNDLFLKYDYLVCSSAFVQKDYYIICGHKGNFRHLTGVTSNIDSVVFFEKCNNGTVTEDDFNCEPNNKGSIRRKMSVLPNIPNIFTDEAYIEENFRKNRINCSLATSDETLTLGFINIQECVPMTLLKGVRLNENKSAKIDLLLRKGKNEERFNEIIIGDNSTLTKYFDSIHDYLDNHLLAAVKKDTLVENIDDDILDLTGGFSNLRR